MAHDLVIKNGMLVECVKRGVRVAQNADKSVDQAPAV